MPPQLVELESLLGQLIAEHRRLLAHVERHEAAVKRLDIATMDSAGRGQESCRLKIVALEQRRRGLVQQIARGLNIRGELTIRKLAALYPSRAAALLAIRAELRGVIEQIATRTHIAGKVAGAVLGHLNTVVRLVAGAVERAGLYTRRGVPRVSSRIGMMDAVG